MRRVEESVALEFEHLLLAHASVVGCTHRSMAKYQANRNQKVAMLM